MTGIEISLIIIGLIFVIGSFFIKDKLSKKDLDTIADLSTKELQIIVDKQMAKVDSKVENFVNDAIDASSDKTKRLIEKTTNEKIMAINEYSDTVLEAINKSHNEVLFLYSMLNDKHTELTGLCSQLQRYSENTTRTVNEIQEERPVNPMEQTVGDFEYIDTLSDEKVVDSDPVEDSALQEDDVNHNLRILQLHKKGYTDVQIARELNLGLGEVRLVIGLFKGDVENEV